MSRLLSIIGHLFVIFSIGFIIHKVINHYYIFQTITWGLSETVFALVAVAYSTSVVLLGSWIWNAILRGGGLNIRFLDAFVIYGQSQIGKYLPGNVFHFVGRAALCKAKGIALEPVVLSMGVETAITILSASIVLAVGLATGTAPAGTLQIFSNGNWMAMVLVLFGVFIAVALEVSRRNRRWFYDRAVFFKMPTVVITTLVNATVFIAYGIIITHMYRLLEGGGGLVQWYHFATGFTVAWLAGFVMPGAPGGIGVREAVFVFLFTPETGAGMATVLAIMVRIVMMLGDVAAFLSAYTLRFLSCKDSKYSDSI